MGDRGISRMRLSGFLRKEVRQILRDPSSILLGIVMPVVLLFLFGYGVSLDPQAVPVALVVEDRGPPARDLAARFALSRYFTPVPAPTMAQAEAWVRRGRIDGIVRIRWGFSAEVLAGRRAMVQLVLNGVDANRARLIQNYVRGVVATWVEMRRVQGREPPRARVAVDHRIWFNDAVDSRHFLVPGLLTLIMTLIGTLLTALVIAREWERGTMEAILATPLRTDELLLGKVIPYFGLGMIGMALSVVLGVTVFDVPLRGSPLLLVALSALFLLAALGLGLMISAFTRVQFVAAQISVVVGFLPAFFLSGLLFDLQSTPPFIRAVSHLIPARYFVTISQTLFLAGNVWDVLLPAAGTLAVMAVVFLGLARSRLAKRVPPP
jgi:ABC-2 type transport system permease protein